MKSRGYITRQGSCDCRGPCPCERKLTHRKHCVCRWEKGSGSWAVRVSGRDETGQRVRKFETVHGNKRDAQTALTRMLKDADDGPIARTPQPETFGHVAEAWLATKRTEQLRATTLSSYSRMLLTHVLPQFGRVPVQKITAGALDRFYAELLVSGFKKGRKETVRGLSPRSVAYVHTLIGAVLSYARKQKLVRVNVAEDATAPRKRTQEVNPWTPQELRAFFGATRADRLYPAWRLGLQTGGRRGELNGLRWSDVDLLAGTVRIRRNRVLVEYEILETEPKTPKSRRLIALDPETVNVLAVWKDRQAQERRVLGLDEDDAGYVFTREDGEPYRPDRFSDLFAQACRQAGVRRIRFHDMRHTHATVGLLAGVHPKVMQERLGHSSISVTMDTYSHVVGDADAAAARSIAALVEGAGPELGQSGTVEGSEEVAAENNSLVN